MENTTARNAWATLTHAEKNQILYKPKVKWCFDFGDGLL